MADGVRNIHRIRSGPAIAVAVAMQLPAFSICGV
jgi:hypothetical protein